MKTTPKIISTKVDIQTYLSQERSLGPACRKVWLLVFGTVAEFRIFKIGWWSYYLEASMLYIFISIFYQKLYWTFNKFLAHGGRNPLPC